MNVAQVKDCLMTFSSFAKFLWPLATATAQSLGPVPPSPFCIAAFFAAQQARGCMQPAVEQRDVAASAWHPPAWCAWPYAPGARPRGARGALEGAWDVDVTSLWGVMGNMGNAQNNRSSSSLQRNINLSLYSYTNFLRIREKDYPFNT